MAKNSRIIRRRTGGVSHRTPAKLNRKYKNLTTGERLEMKGTPGLYNPAKVRPKKKVEKITTPTKKGTGNNLKKLKAIVTETGPATRLYSAVAEGSKRAEKAKERKREAKETPFGIKTQKGRAMLSDAAKKQLNKRKVAREAAIRERAPVRIKTLKPLARQVYKNPIVPQYPPGSLYDPLSKALFGIKTGGKVSRRSGGKVEKWKGGNLEVSQFYD